MEVRNANMHVIKSLTVNYDTPRHCLNFICTVFFAIRPLLVSCDFNLKVFYLRQTNFASYEE